MENESIYMSLDEARVELKKRWADEELKKRIEEELGDKFISYYGQSPIVITPRQLPSPDNGIVFFYSCAAYIGGKAIIQEFIGDKFVSFNEEKKGLGRLRIRLQDNSKAYVDIMNFLENEKKKISECRLLNGDSLIDFHHSLLDIHNILKDVHDDTDWFLNFNSASEYYYYSFLHFVAHGVLFESFCTEEESTENLFTQSVVYPAIERIKNNFGILPMIVKAYPENQTDDEDFYWWDHPKNINDYIIEYAKRNNLLIKPIR